MLLRQFACLTNFHGAAPEGVPKLITLVSIKYTPRFSAVLPGKIVVIAHRGYGGQNISQWTAFGSEQRFFKQGAVFGFGAFTRTPLRVSALPAA
jgi:hypothetical protein